jgi:hypothetical protein
MPKRKTAMTQANVRPMEGTFMNKMNARDSASLQRELAFEKGSNLRLRKSESNVADSHTSGNNTPETRRPG